jgi:hypothetical protein
MKILKFSFKNEAIWMVALSIAPLVIALLILVVGWLLARR